ncbi:MAG TPA: UvrB/UvrC motif-containing protein [Gemmata sp.]|nr:UvrB/UvrC motif-containing protein [Gemmata sp.]
MKCMFCKNSATIHQTVIVNKKKREAHLCEKCARERGLIPDEPGPQIDLKAVLNLMMTTQITSRLADAACPACGLTYNAFKAAGRFGCVHDYDTFRETLENLFEKVHRAKVHRGKLPASLRDASRAATLADLRTRMSAAAAAEDYEEAVRLRDLIRRMEVEGTSG